MFSIILNNKKENLVTLDFRVFFFKFVYIWTVKQILYISIYKLKYTRKHVDFENGIPFN